MWAGGFGLPGPKAGFTAARCRCEVRPPAPAAREPASQFIPVPQVGLCHEGNIKRLTDLESAPIVVETEIYLDNFALDFAYLPQVKH